MFRAIPTNNKLCFDKDLKRSWKIHQMKMKNIKSTLNLSPPSHYEFLDQRAKRAAIQEVRNFQIQKENHSLLTKIKVIGEKGTKASYSRNGSSYDKRRTLNEGFRKRELVKIVQENQDIIKRIQSKKSMYNVKKWGKERKNIQKNITLISSYPFKNYPATQTKVNFWMTDEDISKRDQQDGKTEYSRIKKDDLNFSGTHKIKDQYFLIETRLQNKVFTIEVQNLQKIDQKYRLEMSDKQIQEFLTKNFEGNLKRLFDCLDINEVEKTCELKIYNSDSPFSSREKPHVTLN